MNKKSDVDSPLDRIFAILDYVACQPRAVTIADIAYALSLPLPTTHRLVGNLEERRLLARAPSSKRVVIGTHFVELGAKAIGAGFRNARRHAILRDISIEIGEQCEIGIVQGSTVSYVDSVRVLPPRGLQFEPDVDVPIYCTSIGKIYMSRMTPKSLHKLVHSLQLEAYTSKTITDPEKLIAEVIAIRRSGWAKSNEEVLEGVVGCAVPILGLGDKLIACLGISVPVARISFSELDKFVVPLKKAAMRLSKSMIEPDNDYDAGVRAPITEESGRIA